MYACATAYLESSHLHTEYIECQTPEQKMKKDEKKNKLDGFFSVFVVIHVLCTFISIYGRQRWV